MNALKNTTSNKLSKGGKAMKGRKATWIPVLLVMGGILIVTSAALAGTQLPSYPGGHDTEGSDQHQNSYSGSINSSNTEWTNNDVTYILSWDTTYDMYRMYWEGDVVGYFAYEDDAYWVCDPGPPPTPNGQVGVVNHLP